MGWLWKLILPASVNAVFIAVGLVAYVIALIAPNTGLGRICSVIAVISGATGLLGEIKKAADEVRPKPGTGLTEETEEKPYDGGVIQGPPPDEPPMP